MKTLLLDLVAFVAVMLLGLLAVGLVSGAPVPPKRSKPAPTPTAALVVGAWELTWKRDRGRATFYPDGAFECKGWEGFWTGRWSVAGDVLTVTESCFNEWECAVETATWSAAIEPGTRKGKLVGCWRDFELTPPRVTD